MTTIAVRNGVIAADSTINDGGLHVGRVVKLHRISCGVMAGAGDWIEIMMIRDWLDERGPGDKSPPEQLKGSKASILLLCNNGRLLCYEGQSGFEIEAPFQAIGSGSSIALGAMAAGASAERAVEIACEFDTTSGGPVATEKI